MDDRAPRFFSADYAERAVLRDGTVVVLRLVAPADKELLREGFARMSPESRYARFLAPKDSLSEDELRYLTELDQERHFALGALIERGGAGADGDPGGAGGAAAGAGAAGDSAAGDGAASAPRGAGVARFILLPEAPGTAEAAVAVVDDMHGRGLGKLLFMRLCAAAAERGIARFRCEVLGSNTGMRNLIEDIAADVAVDVHAGVMSIDMAIPDVAPTEPVAGPPPQGAMYRLFRAAAENAVEWTGAVRRLWRRE